MSCIEFILWYTEWSLSIVWTVHKRLLYTHLCKTTTHLLLAGLVKLCYRAAWASARVWAAPETACVTMERCRCAWAQSCSKPLSLAFSTASARPGNVATLEERDAQITCLQETWGRFLVKLEGVEFCSMCLRFVLSWCLNDTWSRICQGRRAGSGRRDLTAWAGRWFCELSAAWQTTAICLCLYLWQ